MAASVFFVIDVPSGRQSDLQQGLRIGVHGARDKEGRHACKILDVHSVVCIHPPWASSAVAASNWLIANDRWDDT